MLERNILAKTSLYVSYAHKWADVNEYLDQIREVFKLLKFVADDCLEQSDIAPATEKLNGPLAH